MSVEDSSISKNDAPNSATAHRLPPLKRRFGAALNLPVTNWQGQRIWLVGASSGIGLACAKALHKSGAKVIISARELSTLSDWAVAAELEGNPLELIPLDVTDALQVKYVARQVASRGALDFMLYCAGHYLAQRATSFDLTEMLRHQDVNYKGLLHVLDGVLPIFLQQGAGHISIVSSVAGWRGLPNSLAYGPTKAAITNLAETLYMDLQDKGIGVSVVNPGFVATPLTAQNTFAMPALITPYEAAKAMLAGWEKGSFDINFPRRFTFWLQLLRLLPYRIYFAIVRRLTGL